ncbi:cold-shock protein [Sutcliffiella halmapala]
MKGRVTKFFQDKGFGFIKDENGDSRFFHVSNIKGYDEILEGSIVRYEPGESKKGLLATNVMLVHKNKDFITIGDTNIRLKNIKNYGITYETEVEVIEIPINYTTGQKAFNRTLGVFQFIVGLTERDAGMSSDGINSFSKGYIQEIKRDVHYKVLYITTYQADNFRFHEKEVNFDIDEKYNELNDYLSV